MVHARQIENHYAGLEVSVCVVALVLGVLSDRRTSRAIFGISVLIPCSFIRSGC